MKETRRCSIDGCDNPHKARGYCNRHYERNRLTGEPESDHQASLDVRLWRRIDKSAGPDACWPWTGSADAQGYGMIAVRSGVTRRTHRVVFFITYGHWPQPECLHSCDNPPCCNPAHLREGTKLENAADCVGRSRRPHKFSDEIYLAVKNSTEAPRILAARYGMDRSTVSRIRRLWAPGHRFPHS
jgi:hypothetical protein